MGRWRCKRVAQCGKLRWDTWEGWFVGNIGCLSHGRRYTKRAEDIRVAVWPTGKEMHQVASRHYAFEDRCYVLAAGALMLASALPPALEAHPGQITHPDQWILRGGSAIIGPDGGYVVKPVFDEPRVLIAELDLGRNREESMTLDVTGHYHRPELFEFGLVHSSRRRQERG